MNDFENYDDFDMDETPSCMEACETPKHDIGKVPVTGDIENLTMMDLVEKISCLAQDSGLSEDFFASAKPFTDILMRRQNLASSKEAVVLSVVIYLGGMSPSSLKEILSYLGCGNMTGLRLKPVFSKLLGSDFIEFFESGIRRGFTVPESLVDCYNADKPFLQENISFVDNRALFYFVEDKLVELCDFNKGTKNIENKISRAFKANRDMPILRSLRAMTQSEYSPDMLLLLHFCADLCFENKRRQRMRDVLEIFKDLELRPSILLAFGHGDHNLFKNKTVEFCATSDGLVDTDHVQLTDAAINKLLPDYKPSPASPKISCASVIRPEQIKELHLFFSEKFQKQVDDLGDLLSEENFKRVQEHLVANGFRKGFCTLFYGAPGTGKTALAKELARLTGRSIMLVDLSSVRDKYVGESEKNVQAIFEGYQKLCATNKRTPILVLNEADALITRRSANATTGVDKMENAMQNILLQSMEDFEGILIATTNLVSNMDSAFDRRFIYKLKFPKPSAEVRAHIWQSKMPKMGWETVKSLASEYDFSGGQIENVARKTLVDSILHGEEKAMENIDDYCKGETLLPGSGTVQKIGF
jgi:hypothetical protein